MITVTPNAIAKIQDVLAEENNPKAKLRIFVQGGGCSGFQYGFTIDEEMSEDDFEVEGILIDAMSMQYLTGAEVDYKEELNHSLISSPSLVSSAITFFHFEIIFFLSLTISAQTS